MALECDVYLCSLKMQKMQKMQKMHYCSKDIWTRHLYCLNIVTAEYFRGSFVIVKTTDEPPEIGHVSMSSTSVENVISGTSRGFNVRGENRRKTEKDIEKKRKVCFFVYNVITHAIIP
jgi:hypothetical protein